MSWQEVLGAPTSLTVVDTHNTHNPQKSVKGDNCADIADCAYRDGTNDKAQYQEILSRSCEGLTITAEELNAELDDVDKEKIESGDVSIDMLKTFAELVMQSRQISQGVRPARFDKPAYCSHCGPVWLWLASEVGGCPWCGNRAKGKPIPRPCLVRCSDCDNFNRIDHPQLGHCSQGQPEAIAGLWGEDPRSCDYFYPAKNIIVK